MSALRAHCTCLTRATLRRINRALYATQTSGSHTPEQILRARNWVVLQTNRWAACAAHGLPDKRPLPYHTLVSPDVRAEATRPRLPDHQRPYRGFILTNQAAGTFDGVRLEVGHGWRLVADYRYPLRPLSEVTCEVDAAIEDLRGCYGDRYVERYCRPDTPEVTDP